MKLQRSLPILLSIISSIGVVATGVLAAKNAEKANKEIRESKNKKEVMKAFFKGYYPALIAGGITISSIIAGTIISKKIEISLAATALALDATLRKYKGKVKELLGDKGSEIISESIFKDDQKKLTNEDKITENDEYLFWEEHVGFFKTTEQKLTKAIELANAKIQTKQGYLSLKEFLNDVDAKMVNVGPIDQMSYEYGWTRDYLQETYSNENEIDGNPLAINIKNLPHYDDNGKIDYYIIIFDRDPIFGITSDYVAKICGYNTCSLEHLEAEACLDRYRNQDTEATALLYDELKYQHKKKE